jgi:hypothetical protein
MRTRTPIAAVVAIILAGALPAPSSAASHDQRPGRGRIAFGAETENGTQIWTVRPNGTHLRHVTQVDGDASQPDCRPTDGSSRSSGTPRTSDRSR